MTADAAKKSGAGLAAHTGRTDRLATAALLALVLAGLLLRLASVRGTFLNPDEAIFASISSRPDTREVLRDAALQAHPPLYFLLLHAWAKAFGSDAGLRLPSVLLGAAAVPLVFVFVRRRAGDLAGLAAAALLALSPSVVDLTAEARPYALLLVLEAAALAAASPPSGVFSPGRLLAAGALLASAELVHYSGVLFAAALLPGLALALLRRSAPRKAWLAFLAAGGAAALAAALLWAVQVRALRGGAMEARAMRGWLRGGYWQDEPFAVFLSRGAAGVFEFLAGFPAAAPLLALAAFAALAWRSRRDPETALLLLAPFLAAFGAAALRVYPLGATRHSAWLLPAAAAALALPLAGIRGSAFGRGLAALAVAAPLWAATASRSTLSAIPREDRRSGEMAAFVGAVASRVSPGDVLLVDRQTAALLDRYLPAPAPPEPHPGGPLRRAAYGGLDVRVSSEWLHEPPTFLADLASLRAEGPPARAVWVANAGAGARLLPDLQAGEGASAVQEPARFGGSLSLFRASAR